MKKIITTLALSLALLTTTTVNAAENFSVRINNKKTTVNLVNVEVNKKKLNTEYDAYAYKNRTFVPIREITETLGAKVEWDKKTNSTTITLADKKLKIKTDSDVVYVNGKKKIINDDTIPRIAQYKNGDSKTMVPLRFLSENLGYDVGWNNSTQTASVNSFKSTPKEVVKKEDVKKTPVKETTKNVKKEAKPVVKSTDNNKFVSPKEKQEMNNLKSKSEGDQLRAVSLTFEDKKEEKVISKTIKQKGKVTIVIDPGHGGTDSGAITESGLKEKELNLKVAKRLQSLLGSTNYEIIMTRTRDEYVKLVDRASMANDEDAEIFLSIHFNSSENQEAKGIEVLYAAAGGIDIKTVEQSTLARELLNAVIKETGAENRGIKNRPDLVVLNKTKNVAALAELGFMSNPDDYKDITEDAYLDKLATGLYKGLNNYINKYVEK